MKYENLIKRTITSFIIFAYIYNLSHTFPSYVLSITIFVISCLAQYEYFTLNLENKKGNNKWLMLTNCFNLLLTFYITIFYQDYHYKLLNCLIVLNVSSQLIFNTPLQLFYENLFGMIYTIYFPSYFILLYKMNKLQLYNDVLKIASFDIGSYVVGNMLGRTPFTQHSPNKTIEGVIGGTLITILTTYCLDNYFNIVKTFILICIALIGDLFQSLIKRANNCKDTGTIIYGHGGMLDRVDSYIFNVVILYLFYCYSNT